MEILNPNAVGDPAATPVVRLSTDEAVALFGSWLGIVELPSGAPTGMDAPCCGEEYADRVCTRPPDHTGRHLAYGTTYVVAAWPGWQAPTAADLEG